MCERRFFVVSPADTGMFYLAEKILVRPAGEDRPLERSTACFACGPQGRRRFPAQAKPPSRGRGKALCALSVTRTFDSCRTFYDFKELIAPGRNRSRVPSSPPLLGTLGPASALRPAGLARPAFDS